jgi:glycosyltransferase involved in cell wall biosynthesis
MPSSRQRLGKTLALQFHPSQIGRVSRNQHADTHRIERRDYIILSMMSDKSAASKAVVFVSVSYFPTVGGTERQVQALAERWAALGKPIWVVTRRLPQTAKHDLINGIHVFRIPALWLPVFSWLTFSLSFLLFLIPRRRLVGCFIAQMLNVAALSAALASRLFSIPLLIKLTASGPDVGNVSNLRRSFLGGWKLRFLCAQSRWLIPVTDEIAQELLQEGAPAAKLRKIPNGVDIAYFHRGTVEERQKNRDALGLTPQASVALFVGRLDKIKNLSNLLKIWSQVAAKVPSARLLIAGDGEEKSALQRDIQGTLRQSVSLLGEHQNVRGLYQAADLFIFPSFSEGLSNALLEAMACELPVVASWVGGNKELLVPEENGFKIDPAQPGAWVEPLSRLLLTPDLRLAMGREARRRVTTHFSFESTLEMYRSLSQEG